MWESWAGVAVVLMGLAAGCAHGEEGMRAAAPRIAVAYNLVPQQRVAGTEYGGDNTLEVFVNASDADAIRQNFIQQASGGDSLQFVALDTFDAAGNPTCPQALDLSDYLLEVGGESFVCVERSFYYNDVIGAAVATTRVDLYSAEGDLLWRGNSTKGIGLKLWEVSTDIYNQTRRAAERSNKEAVRDLRKAMALFN